MGSSAKKVGLFVGFGKYAESDAFAALPGAPRDADKMDAFFKKLGFMTKCFNHDTLPGDGLLFWIGQLVQQLGEGDTFVFFFAGHGHTSDITVPGYSATKEQYILLPSASAEQIAKKNFYAGALPVTAIEAASKRPGLQRLFILDCCRGGKKQTNNVNRDAGTNDTAQTFHAEIVYRSMVGSYESVVERASPLAIYNSCRDGSLAKELPGGHGGLFSNCWLDINEKQLLGGRPIVLSPTHESEVGQLMIATANRQQIATDGYDQSPLYLGPDIQLWAPELVIETNAKKIERLKSEFSKRLLDNEFDEPYGACARDVLAKLIDLRISNTEQRELSKQLQDAKRTQRLEKEAVDKAEQDAALAAHDTELINEAEIDNTEQTWLNVRYALKLPANRELARLKVSEFKYAANAKNAFEKLKESRGLADFDKFLNEFSGSAHTAQVQAWRNKAVTDADAAALADEAAKNTKVEDAAFEHTENEQTLEACEKYLKQYPLGRYLATVTKLKEELQTIEYERLESEAFERVKREPSVEACNEFLRQFEGGQHVPEAQQLLVELVEETNFEKCKFVNTIAAFDDFLKTHQSGRHALTAQKLRDDLQQAFDEHAEDEEFATCKTKNTVMAYEAYLTQYPYGKYELIVKGLKEKIQIAGRESPVRKAFNNVMQVRSVEICQWFLQQYGRSQYVPVVKELLQELVENVDFERCKSANTIAEFNKFLAAHPHCKHVLKVVKLKEKLQTVVDDRLENEAFDRVKQQRNIESCNWFLRQYESSLYVPAVQQLLWELVLEADFERCKSANTVEACDIFLKAYPRGRHAATVEGLREKLQTSTNERLEIEAFSHVKQQRSVQSCNWFLQKYPRSQHVAAVKQLLNGLVEEDEFAKCKSEDTAAAFDAFLVNHPSSRHTDEVRKLRRQLDDQWILGPFNRPLRWLENTTSGRWVLVVAGMSVFGYVYFNPSVLNLLPRPKNTVVAAAPAPTQAVPATVANTEPKTTYAQYLTLRTPVTNSQWWQSGTGPVPAGAQAMIDAAAELAGDSANPLAQIDLADFYNARSSAPDQAKAVELYARWYANPSNTTVSTSDKQLLVRNVANNLSTALRVGIARPPGELDWRGASTAIMALKAYPAQFWQARVIKCLLPTDANTPPRVKAVLQAAAAADGPQFLTDDYRSLAIGQLDPVALNRTCRDADENAPKK